MKGWNMLKESFLSGNLGNSFIGKKDIPNNSNELKFLRKEYILYKNTVEYLSNDLNNLKTYQNEKDKIFEEYQKDQEILYNNQIEAFTRSLRIYKDFYEDELNVERCKITDLSNVMDEILVK